MIRHFRSNQHDMDVFACEIMQIYQYIIKGKSILQVGGRGAGCIETFQIFKNKGYDKCDLLEIFKPNLDGLKNNIINNKILGDVRIIDKLIKSPYDVIGWFHGPEHISKSEFITTLPKIMSLCNIFVIGCPYGIWEQGAIHNNPHEVHISHWYPEELEILGFDMYLFGNKPDDHGVMLGVLTKEKYVTLRKL